MVCLNVCQPLEEKWVTLHFHISRVYLMPDRFNVLNYACRIIISNALIFKQILTVVNFMLKGRWWSNERSSRSHRGSCLHCPIVKNKQQREILIATSDLSLCLLADDTKIALHLRDNQGKSSASSALVSGCCCCYGCCRVLCSHVLVAGCCF